MSRFRVDFMGHKLVDPRQVVVAYLSGHGGPNMWAEIKYVEPYLATHTTGALDRLELLTRIRPLDLRSWTFMWGLDEICGRYCHSCKSSVHLNDDSFMPGDTDAWPHLFVPIRVDVWCHRRLSRSGRAGVQLLNLTLPNQYEVKVHLDFEREHPEASAHEPELKRRFSELLRPLLAEATPQAREELAAVTAAKSAEKMSERRSVESFLRDTKGADDDQTPTRPA